MNAKELVKDQVGVFLDSLYDSQPVDSPEWDEYWHEVLEYLDVMSHNIRMEIRWVHGELPIKISREVEP
jgi:hypothetical protein